MLKDCRWIATWNNFNKQQSSKRKINYKQMVGAHLMSQFSHAYHMYCISLLNSAYKSSSQQIVWIVLKHARLPIAKHMMFVELSKRESAALDLRHLWLWFLFSNKVPYWTPVSRLNQMFSSILWARIKW